MAGRPGIAAKPTKKSENKKAKAKNTKVKKTRSEEPVIYKGLAGVTVDYTAVSKVMPETNSLTYRGMRCRISLRTAGSRKSPT